MTEPVPLKYRAFISYSHADTSWAKWLHRALESFAIDKDLAGRETANGPVPTSLRPIFRDRDDFTAGHALSEQTLAALDASHALIVICSPASAKSHYVNEEVRLFKSRHPERALIPLIVDGKPGDPKLECFVPALKFELDAAGTIADQPVELLAADAREEGDGKQLALAKVVAGLLGVSSDDIFRRAERQRRAALRRRRSLQSLFGVLVVLLAGAGVAWLYRDNLIKEYYWTALMGPNLLTGEQERALQSRAEFKECAKGCPAMVVVPQGKFVMGSPEGQGQDYERPQHAVTIAKPFAVSKFEVTQEEWQACVDFGDCEKPASSSTVGNPRNPVDDITWDQAKTYVAWLSRMTGKTYRLLSEAEWEFAARAGTATTYPWGEAVGQGHANCSDCGGGEDHHRAAPVGSYPANGFGLYDMQGNVSEWVEDCGNESYNGAPSDGSAWTNGSCDMRVTRGGSYLVDHKTIASSARVSNVHGMGYSSLGFRVARTLPETPPLPSPLVTPPVAAVPQAPTAAPQATLTNQPASPANAAAEQAGEPAPAATRQKLEDARQRVEAAKAAAAAARAKIAAAKAKIEGAKGQPPEAAPPSTEAGSPTPANP